MPALTTEKQQTGAFTEGSWHWRAVPGTLHIEASGRLMDLSGHWTLDAFTLQLEGLSRARLARALVAEEGKVQCPLVLSDGRRVQMTGMFRDKGMAEGVFARADENRTVALGEPGPSLTPAFQPILSLSTGEIAGFEALARWGGHEAGADHEFEDPALATNMLIQSAEALARWQAATGRRDLFVHVNLTGRDLATGDIPGLVEALVQGYDLPVGTLKAELTEQAALRNTDGAVKAVSALRHAGAGVVLDDFGSGHSSFLWLADIQADSLKIDPTLSQRIHQKRTRIILEAVTLLASRLNMQVIAEGVEDLDDVATLRAVGFQYAQGFAFARPLFAEDALTYLQNTL